MSVFRHNAPGRAGLPPTRQACRERIDQLRDDIAAIKAQIAAADLERQRKHGTMDARWFHRARTALRHKQREVAKLSGHMATLPKDSPDRSAFKDCLIEVLRTRFDDAKWRAVLDEARRIHEERGQV